MDPFVPITKADDLRNVCEKFANSDWLAIDTEFERVRTYYPEPCLIQIANARRAVLIDALMLDDLEPLFSLLDNTSIDKILHSSHQDLEILSHLKKTLPAPIFDTQIAAKVLGYGDQIAYAALVKKLLGVELDQSSSRSDWKRRPLGRKQLEYALNDVRYLGPLYLELSRQLRETDQLAEAEAFFSELSKPERYYPHPDQAWRRIRAARRLEGRKHLALQRLAAWREVRARACNRPRNWVLKDRILLQMARALPENHEALGAISALTPKLIDKHGDTWLALIHGAD